MLSRRGFGQFIAEAVSWGCVYGSTRVAAQRLDGFSEMCDNSKPFTLDDVSSFLPEIRAHGEPRFQVFAYYYPSWHRDPDLAARLGRPIDWTEWTVLTGATPVAPCEIEPKS